MTISSDVGDRRAAFLLEHQTEFPGVQITETYLRRYEQGTIAAQILGYEAEITAEQLAASESQGLSPPATGSARPGSRPPTTRTSAVSPASGACTSTRSGA